MSIKDFLEYSIIQTDHFEVTPYSILMILIIIFVTWSLLWFIKIVEYPKAFVRFNDFGNSSLDFQLYFWTTKSFRVENLKSDLRFAIDKEFRRENITIPFPQTDVHIKSEKE